MDPVDGRAPVEAPLSAARDRPRLSVHRELRLATVAGTDGPVREDELEVTWRAPEARGLRNPSAVVRAAAASPTRASRMLLAVRVVLQEGRGSVAQLLMQVAEQVRARAQIADDAEGDGDRRDGQRGRRGDPPA